MVFLKVMSDVIDVANDLPSSSTTTATTEGTDITLDEVPVYCLCPGSEEGTMIACDNPNCQIEWFHTSCLQMTIVPKGKAKWYCPDCRVLPQFLKKTKIIYKQYLLCNVYDT